MPGFLVDFFQAVNMQWVVDQAVGGNAEPLFWWTLSVFSAGIALGWTSSYANMRYRAKRPVKTLFMGGMSKGLAKAMLNALDADGMIPMGALDKEIMGVHDAGLKVFVYSDSWDYVGSGSCYQLTNEWRRYLRRPWRRKRLERLAGK